MCLGVSFREIGSVWLGEKIEAFLLPSARGQSAMGAQSLTLSIVFWSNIFRIRLSPDRRRPLRATAKGAALGDYREQNVRDVVQKQGTADSVSGRRLKMAAVQIMVDYQLALKHKLAGHALLWLSENDGKDIGVRASKSKGPSQRPIPAQLVRQALRNSRGDLMQEQLLHVGRRTGASFIISVVPLCGELKRDHHPHSASSRGPCRVRCDSSGSRSSRM
jgi:hypothetical protein